MRAFAAAAVMAVLGACGFDLKLGTQLDAGGSDSGTDGDIGDGPAIDAQIGPPVACATPSTNGLVACFELEDGVTDGTLRDSAPAHRDATTMGLVAAQRTTTSAAATVTPTVHTYVPDTDALDLAGGYTVTMWVRPTAVPAVNKVFGLYDHELQFAAVIGRTVSGEAHLRCINTTHPYEYSDTIPVDTWSFIACTWDGSQLCAQYWTSPTEHQRYCTTTSIVANGAQGLAIGHLSSGGVPESPLTGSFDSLQLYDHPLEPDELCGILGEPAGCLPCTGGC